MSKTPNNHEPTPDELVDTEEFETTDEEGAEAMSQQKLKSLRDKLKDAEAAKREALEELQRAKADFLNTRKRLEQQQVQAVKRNEDAFVAALLPLTDSFTMAMKDQAAWNAVDESWRKGVEGIHQQLLRILESHEVVAINPETEPFDPNRHEAVGTKPYDGESDLVVEVVQAGYERNGDVLRPAKVIISA